jgi:monothiol glutaredoxin
MRLAYAGMAVLEGARGGKIRRKFLREQTMDVLERIKTQVTDNPIILYMKGTPDFPQCGFSSRTVQALNACGVEYAYVNIYEDEEVYRALPKFANWPTFPQLYVKGELVGGCDITLDLFQSGDLKKMLEEAVGKKQAA